MLKKNEQIHSGRGLTGIIIAASAAVITLALYMLLTARTSWHPVALGLVLILLYTAGIALWQLLAAVYATRSVSEGSSLNPVLGNIMLDMVQKMNAPVLICDEATERIIWHNRSVSLLLPGRKSLHGATATAVLGASVASLMNPDMPADRVLTVSSRSFRAKGYRIHSAERSFCLLLLTETTELEELRHHIENRNLVVGYIMIDNVDEMLQYEQERYRSTASRIDTILRDWATEAHGILKEYERDRYLLLMTRENLRLCSAGKFEVLDTIRDIHFGEASQPVTISAGFADISGSYAEKEKAAQQSLDMALQRGGDQIVVKADGALEFYGGRTKTVQKRTRVRSRVVATELLSLISRASGVLIMSHRFADFDAFASSVGLARLCLFCGVPVNIVTDPNDPNLRGCRAMLEGEEEYRGVFIDAATGLDLIRTDTLLIITDVNNPPMFESQEIAAACEKAVFVDHHRKASEFVREPLIAYIEPSASAASELVAEMLEQVLPSESLLPAEANLLLAGILLDTKQFTKNTGTRTFSAALYLRDRGADPAATQNLFRTDLDDFRREAKFRSNVIIFREVTAIAVGEGEGAPPDRIAAAKAADKLLGVAGVEASFALIKIGDCIHVSARSAGTVNVQLILEKCGGGGHFDSAAAQLAESMDDALSRLKDAICAYLAQNAE